MNSITQRNNVTGLEKNATGIDKSDRAGLWLTIGISALLAGATMWTAFGRLREIYSDTLVSVTGHFTELPMDLPIGAPGSTVAGDIDSATIQVSGLPAAIVIFLSLGVVLSALGTLGVWVSLAWLCKNLAMGIAFCRTNTRLLMSAALSILVGWVGGQFFTHMGVNGAFAVAVDQGAALLSQEISLFPFFSMLTLSAASLAFSQGERLQRELDGLV